jgi:predicted ferric reductase
MSWEELFKWTPIWEWSMTDWFISVTIAIGYMVIRYYLYKYNIIEPRYKKELRKFQKANKDFWDKVALELEEHKHGEHNQNNKRTKL